MTTAENTTGAALAVRAYSSKELEQRIRLNQKAGYGLERANQATLNIVFLMCQRYGLDPVSDVTLFEGRPFITIDGRLRLLRAHPEYRGYTCRPLTRAEKPDWGYEPDDIVIECTVRTTTWGEISARGKVSAAEVKAARERAESSGKRPAPIGVHPVEIAEKRAIARAERAAFGQDVLPDEDEARIVIEERNTPEVQAQRAATYDAIVGTEDDWDRGPYTHTRAQQAQNEVVAPDEEDRSAEVPVAEAEQSGRAGQSSTVSARRPGHHDDLPLDAPEGQPELLV